MKKYALLFMVSGLCCILNAQENVTADYSLSMEAGHRSDTLNWNYPDSSGTPNILSELSWNDIQSYYGKIELQGFEGPYRLKLNYLESLDSYSGTNQDSDYNLDNRQGEFSRSNNKAKNSTFVDYTIAVGENYNISKKSDVIIWLGYEVNEQNLRINDGYQTIPATGYFANLDSSYFTKWKGFFGGLEYQYNLNKIKLNADFSYHYMDYEAKAHWNLSPNFQKPLSFVHEADGVKGIKLKVDIEYLFNDAVTFFANYTKTDYSAKDGINRQYQSSGAIVTGKLSEVNWESDLFGLGIRYNF